MLGRNCVCRMHGRDCTHLVTVTVRSITVTCVLCFKQKHPSWYLPQALIACEASRNAQFFQNTQVTKNVAARLGDRDGDASHGHGHGHFYLLACLARTAKQDQQQIG